MPAWAIILIAVVAILIILIIAGIGYKNSFVVLSNQVEEAFSTMDVYLKNVGISFRILSRLSKVTQSTKKKPLKTSSSFAILPTPR